MEKLYKFGKWCRITDDFDIVYTCEKASRNQIRNKFPGCFRWLNPGCNPKCVTKDDLGLLCCHEHKLGFVYSLIGWDDALNPCMWGGVLDDLDV